MPSCLVNQCVSKTGRKGQSEQIILHPFPKDISRIMVWLQQTGQIFKDLNALAQKILEGNKQNKYRLCSCHFTPDSYIINVNHHGKSLRVDAVPSIFPIVREGECIIEENLKKSRVRKRKRPFDTAADFLQQPLMQLPTTFINETFEEEMLRDVEITRIGFCSIGTQTDYALSNSVLLFNKNQAVGSDGLDRSFTPDAVTSSLGLMSQLKLHMDSLLQEVPIRFDDVAVYFSAEEWESLEMAERLLYMDVMLDNYYTLFSLGFVYEKPEIISIIEKCQALCQTADVQPIKVKEEPEYYSDTDVSTGYWKVESSVCGKQELRLQVQMCSGVEQPLYHTEESMRQDPVDQSFYNDVKTIKVKEEPFDYSETNMSTRDWSAESSACVKRELPSQAQICNGFEQPVYHSGDSTGQDRVDQRFYNVADTKCINVKEEPFDYSETDVSTRDWRAANGNSKQGLLLQAQTCSEVERPVFHSEDSTRRDLPDRSFYNEMKRIKVKEEPFDYSEADVSTRDWRAESSVCIKQELLLQVPTCNGVEQPFYRSKDSTRQDLVDQSFFNDVQPITVKEEHEYFSETDVSPRREESSVCSKQELLLEAQMCNGDEQPVSHAEDSTRQDIVDQHFGDGNTSLVQTNSDQSQGKTWIGSGATKSGLTVGCKSHLTEKHYTCTDCGKCFNRSSHLLRHKRIHVGERPYFCGKCGKSFIDSSQLVIHRRTHTGEKPYACSDCDMKFICKLHLVRHQRSHTGERPYVCSKCGKGFAQSSNLLTHLRTHTGEKPYSCSSCEKCFIRRSHLVRHQRIHTGQGPYACNECDKSFTESSGLLKHLRTHSGEKPYTCSQCPKSFTDKSALANHQRTHTGERPYPCRDCGKTFSHSSALVKHIRIHTGEKPYTCRKCGKGFSQTSALVNHERTHTGQKPFSCSDCGKCFTQASSLVKHQRTHTGVRPYTCGECGKSFTYSSVLVKHERTHIKSKVD